MEKDIIVQFTGFITVLDSDEFMDKWESFSGNISGKPAKAAIMEKKGQGSRFRYVAVHQQPEAIQYAPAQKKRPGSFPEHTVKVVPLGGYSPVRKDAVNRNAAGLTRVIAFVNHNETDTDFYYRLQGCEALNTWQAYYESCAFAWVMEYFAGEAEAGQLVQQLKTRHGNEVAVYASCIAPVAVR